MLFVGYVRLRLAAVPLERDEGEYAYAGRLILEGIPPYQLAYNMKFPGTYYAYAAIMAVFGQTPWGIHVGLLFVNAATILLVLAVGRRLLGEGDTLAGLKKSDIQKLEECVRKTIARVVNPELSRIPGNFPHRKFSRWLVKTARQKPVEIFTVNYDILIEHGLEAERIPVFDGFVGSFQPFFNPDSLRRPEAAPGANWARLWKMHGSVTWRRIEQDVRF